MNVLYLTHRLPYLPNRGDRIRAYHMLREMTRFARVSVFSYVHDDQEEAYARQIEGAERVEVVRIHRTRSLLAAGRGLLSSGRPLTHCLLDAPGTRRRLAEMIARTTPDVVLAYCSGMARLVLEPPLGTFPFALDMVDVDSSKWARLGASSAAPKSWIYRREARTLGAFEATAATIADATIVVNGRERDELLQLAPAARAVVIENGIDVAAFRPPGPPSAAPTVIFCGVMDYYPNEEGVVWFAQRIWPLVTRVRPDARFLVVGSRPVAAVRALAQHDPTIEVTGTVPEVQPFLWRSALAVAPLRLAQGLQNKVLEAIAAGLPVVVTPQVAEGLPAQVTSSCTVGSSVEELAAGVLRFLEMSPQARAAQAGSARLEELMWPRRLSSLRETLERVAARAPVTVTTP